MSTNRSRCLRSAVFFLPCVACSAAPPASGESRSEATSAALGTPAPGTLDATFGTGGVAVAPVPLRGAVYAAVQSNDAVVAAGMVADAATGGNVVAVVRFTADGALDSTFGQGGVVRNSLVGDLAGVAVTPSGKIVVALTDGQKTIGAVQYTSTGALDSTFGNGGRVDTGQPNSASLLLVQPNGDILIAGTDVISFGGRRQPGNIKGVLVRLTPTGALDAAFGTGGVVTSSNGQPQPGTFRYPSAMALDSAGNIFVLDTSQVLGTSQSNATLAEFSSTGAPSATVSLNGAFTTVSAADFGAPAFQPNGSYLIAGLAAGVTLRTHLVKVSRFLLNGNADPSFTSPAFSFGPEVVNRSSGSEALLVGSGGTVFVGGGAPVLGDASSGSSFGLAELETNGALDAAFGNGGTVVTQVTASDTVTALVQQSSGKVVALGESTSGIGAARYIAP